MNNGVNETEAIHSDNVAPDKLWDSGLTTAYHYPESNQHTRLRWRKHLNDVVMECLEENDTLISGYRQCIINGGTKDLVSTNGT